MSPDPRVRRAARDDADEVARLMYDFNTEFDEETDEPEVLARRYREQLGSGDVTVVLGGDGPDGFAQLRYQGQIYSDAPTAYLEELYVAPPKRGEGLGRALLEAAMDEARAHGADHIDLGTSEDDTAARGLYESLGFTNREGKPDGPSMLYYERDL
ncbi:MAG: GNAT family N-acetyltransferase [Solirubrobacterales bacterium]